MQIKITINPREKFSIPLSYNYQIQSMIYDLLENEPDYASFLHNKGFGYGFRLFTFGQLRGEYVVSDKHMTVLGKITLEIRSSSTEFCNILKSTLIKREKVKLFDRVLDINMIECDCRRIEKCTAEIYTLSPITARFNNENGSTIYYDPEQFEFTDIICRNLINKYESFTGMKDNNFDFKYIGGKKKVVTQYKNIWVTAYHLKAKLNGKPELLDFAYQTGLGSRSAQGFGMFETV